MSVSYKQAAANLAAALVSGNSQDAESALASYERALGGKEAPEPDLGPIKSSLEDRNVPLPAEADVLDGLA